MTLYDNLLSQLKTKYASLGLGDGVLQSVAHQLEAGLEGKEELIGTAVNGAEPLLKTMQSELDKLRGEKATLLKQLETLKQQPQPQPEKPAPAPQPAPKAAKPAPKAEEKPQADKADAPHATEDATRALIERIVSDRLGSITEAYNEKAREQQSAIDALGARLKEADEARAKAERLAAYKATADSLGISKAYESVIDSFAQIAADPADFEQRVKAFKQSLTDDAARSATPPDTPEQTRAKEGEAIASLIDEGTKQIVEQQSQQSQTK